MGKPQSSSTLNKNVEPFYPSDDGRRQMYSRGNAKSRNSRYHLRRHPPLPAGPAQCHKMGHVMALLAAEE